MQGVTLEGKHFILQIVTLKGEHFILLQWVTLEGKFNVILVIFWITSLEGNSSHLPLPLFNIPYQSSPFSGITASTLVSQWTWAATLLQSTGVELS